MSPLTKLADSDLNASLQSLTDWSLEDGKLTRTFHFKDFVGAFGFMASVALVAERMNHHPEWFNVFGTVRVQLSTHEVGGLSSNDFLLAKLMSQLALGHNDA